MCFFLLGHPLRDLPISKPWCLWDLVKDVVDPPLSSYPEKKTSSCDARPTPSRSGAPLARRVGQVAVADASAKIWLSSASESYAFWFPLTLGSSRRAYGGRKNPGNALRSRFLYEKMDFRLFFKGILRVHAGAPPQAAVHACTTRLSRISFQLQVSP